MTRFSSRRTPRTWRSSLSASSTAGEAQQSVAPVPNDAIKIISGPENHAWTVLGTLLACGAVGMAAWAISNAGALDLAATGLFFFFMPLISMMLKAGLIVVPEKNRKDFGETRGLLKTAWREFQEFQGRSPIWRMALLALGFTVGYMIFRWGLSVALGIFSNVWIAGAASALIAS